MQTFTLTLDGGNAEMQTPQDVATALEKLAAGIREMDGMDGFSSYVRDVNGNTVGEYRYNR